MADGFFVAEALEAIKHDGQSFGTQLASMLERSTFSVDEKEAWARLIPYMTTGELDRLSLILERNLAGEVANEMEDIMLQAKAAEMKRSFALTHAEQKAMEDLDSIESELKQLEAKGA